MKEFIKNWWGLIVVFMFILLLFVLVVYDVDKKNLEKFKQANFMVINKCTLEIKDITLNRNGCIDVSNVVHWRKE